MCCSAATESLSTHKLPGGPEFGIGGVHGTKSLSVSCNKAYSHAFQPAGKPNGHSFVGEANTWLSVVPVPAAKLQKTKAWLQHRIGADISAGLAQHARSHC